MRRIGAALLAILCAAPAAPWPIAPRHDDDRPHVAALGWGHGRLHVVLRHTRDAPHAHEAHSHHVALDHGHATMADDHDHVLHATTPPPLLRQTAAIDVTPPAPRPLDLVPSTQWALAPLAVLRAAPPTQSLTFLRSTVLLV